MRSEKMPTAQQHRDLIKEVFEEYTVDGTLFLLPDQLHNMDETGVDLVCT